MIARQRGTPVLVNIWASWCGPCRQEAPFLAAANRTYGDRVRFVGVDILDERGSARDFIRASGWTYPSVYDPSGAIRDALGVIGQPATLFYDADGTGGGAAVVFAQLSAGLSLTVSDFLVI